jgi:hypothetical protein
VWAFAIRPQDCIRITSALYGVLVASHFNAGGANDFLVHPPTWFFHQKAIDLAPRLGIFGRTAGTARTLPRPKRKKNPAVTQLRHPLLVATNRTFHDMSSFEVAMSWGKSPS